MSATSSYKFRLKLTTERWIDWYSESQVLTEAQAMDWINQTLGETVGIYLKQAERYDPERNEWMVF